MKEVKKLLADILAFIVVSALTIALITVATKDDPMEYLRRKSDEIKSAIGIAIDEEPGTIDIGDLYDKERFPNLKDIFDWESRRNNGSSEVSISIDLPSVEIPGGGPPSEEPPATSVEEVSITSSAEPPATSVEEIPIQSSEDPIEQPATEEPIIATLNSLKVGEPEKVDYDRSEWNHWTYSDRSCWNTRDEVLYRSGSNTTLLDKNKNTSDYSSACYVESGEWMDPFSGTLITNPSKIDIDHIVPLSYASQHGGNEWSPEKKEEFANDYSNLLAVSSSQNRSKRDKSPADWLPDNKEYHKQYIIAWIEICNKYDLSITEKDYNLFLEVLSGK